jgi:hypothetical protein
MRRRSLIALALVVRAAVARADGVAEEITVGTTVATPESPARESLGNRISATWDPSDRWELSFDVGATRSRSTAISALSNDAVITSLSADHTVTNHWSVSVTAGWSPRIVSSSVATIEADGLPGGMPEIDVNVTSSSWMTSLGATVSYDTAGEDDFEVVASASASASYFESVQAITSLHDPTGQTFTNEEMRAHCAITMCTRELRDGLWPQWTQVRQFVVGGSVRETAFEDTDLGLDFDYYLYDRDPTEAGYFAIATVEGGSLGEGMAVAPMRFAMTPSIARRFGDISTTATFGYGSYINHLGHELSANLRVQVKFKLGDDKRLKLYAKLNSSWDVPPDYPASQALSLAVGGQFGW